VNSILCCAPVLQVTQTVILIYEANQEQGWEGGRIVVS